MAGPQLLSTYSPEAVSIIISNEYFSHVITGIADGTFLTISRMTPATSLEIGGDLFAQRIRRSNRSSSISLMLMQGSTSNDVLSQILRNDEDAMDNTWLFNITIKDNSGRSVFFSPQAYVVSPPDISFGTEGEMREWTIECIHLDQHVGGGANITPDTASTLEDVGYNIPPGWVTE